MPLLINLLYQPLTERFVLLHISFSKILLFLLEYNQKPVLSLVNVKPLAYAVPWKFEIL